MDEMDIKLYIKAKIQNSGFNRVFSLVLLASVFTFILLTYSGFEFQYMNTLGLALILGYIVQNKEFKLFGSRMVTSKDLLSVIERQINRDPSALQNLKGRS
ncbi:MAG: hypothetical protein JKY24_06150 [Pseudomonadales bacterium]|nr:hypothetical protein [Pseudomonadales bacterium]